MRRRLVLVGFFAVTAVGVCANFYQILAFPMFFTPDDYGFGREAGSRTFSCLGYDDSLDAFGVHGAGGTVGAILTGVFATRAVNTIYRDILSGEAKQILTGLVCSVHFFASQVELVSRNTVSLTGFSARRQGGNHAPV